MVRTSLPESYFNIGSWGWPAILAMIVSIVLSFFTGMFSATWRPPRYFQSIHFGPA
jgi:hypothetical protein